MKAWVKSYPINYERKLKSEEIDLSQDKPGNVGRLVKLVRLGSEAHKNFFWCLAILLVIGVLSHIF